MRFLEWGGDEDEKVAEQMRGLNTSKIPTRDTTITVRGPVLISVSMAFAISCGVNSVGKEELLAWCLVV